MSVEFLQCSEPNGLYLHPRCLRSSPRNPSLCFQSLERTSDSIESMGSPQPNVSGFASAIGGMSMTLQETIASKMSEALAIFQSCGDDANDPMVKMMPMMVTAMSVVVSEVVKGVMTGIEERLASIASLRPESNSDRLMAAVGVLTYENDRLQQYTRRESVRGFGLPQSARETAEEVEQKVVTVFKELRCRGGGRGG